MAAKGKKPPIVERAKDAPPAELLFRACTLERETANPESRSVALAFSSEQPVERWWGVEILDHSPESVMLGRLKDGGPLLVGHNTDEQVGVVEQAYIGGDRKGRAIVRFGKSARAEEIFRDVLDGIRRHVSVGYQIHAMKLEQEKDGLGTYRANSWEPMEISMVPVPADATVGVGREFDPREHAIPAAIERSQPIMPDEKKETPVLPDTATLQREAVDKERSRVNGILELGRRHNHGAQAEKAIAENKTVDEFRAAILEGYQPKALDTKGLNDDQQREDDAQRRPAVRQADIKVQIRQANGLYKEGRAIDPKKEFRTFGEQMIAVMNAERGMIDSRLSRAASGLSEGIPSDGGFAIQPDFSQELLMRTYEMGQILNRVRKIPITTNANGLKINAVDETSRANGSRWGGVQVYRQAEADSTTATKPKFRLMELSLKKLMGVCYMTDELLQDAGALEAVLMQAFPDEFMFKMEDEIINGTGAGQMLGILNGGCLVSVAKETGQLAATIVVENIVNMYARCWSRSLSNANWYVNQDIFPQLFTMGITFGTGGQAVYLPPGGLSATPYGTLMGRPIIPVEYCATRGTVGDIILGDFSQYLMIDKAGLQAAQSIHVRFLNDEMTFRWTMRNDGQPSWNSALTPKNGTNTLSPFVVLATRS